MRQALIFLMALMLAGAAHAQLYKWVDTDGKVRYGDSPPPGAKASALKGAQSSAAVASARRLRALTSASQGQVR